jgi:hypothetical protein
MQYRWDESLLLRPLTTANVWPIIGPGLGLFHQLQIFLLLLVVPFLPVKVVESGQYLEFDFVDSIYGCFSPPAHVLI